MYTIGAFNTVMCNLCSFGASHAVPNEKGVSPYDLAVRSDYNSIIALFNNPLDKKPAKSKAKKGKMKKGRKRIDSSDSENDSDLF